MVVSFYTPTSVYECSNYFTFLPTFGFKSSFILAIFLCLKRYLTVILICSSLMTKDVKYFLCYCQSSSFVRGLLNKQSNVLFLKTLFILLIFNGLFMFLLLFFRGFLIYIQYKFTVRYINTVTNFFPVWHFFLVIYFGEQN